jgi:hypothetical protein
MNAGTCWGKNTIGPRGRFVEKAPGSDFNFNFSTSAHRVPSTLIADQRRKKIRPPMKWVPGTLPEGRIMRHASDHSRLSSGALPPALTGSN